MPIGHFSEKSTGRPPQTCSAAHRGAQGAALYVTNTEAYICITDSAQVQGGSGVAVKAAAGQWGSSGNNGGRLVLRSDGAMEGAIEYDSLSSVETVTAAETEANAKTP